MSPAASRGRSTSQRFPRVSGDEPGKLSVRTVAWLFSSRERG